MDLKTAFTLELGGVPYACQHPPVAKLQDFKFAMVQLKALEGSDRHGEIVAAFEIVWDGLRWIGAAPPKEKFYDQLDAIILGDDFEVWLQAPDVKLKDVPSDVAPTPSSGDDWIDLLACFETLEQAQHVVNSLSRTELQRYLWRLSWRGVDEKVRRQSYYEDESVWKEILTPEQDALNKKFARQLGIENMSGYNPFERFGNERSVGVKE